MELVIIDEHTSKQTKQRQPQGARKALKKTMKLKQAKKKDRKKKRDRNPSLQQRLSALQS